MGNIFENININKIFEKKSEEKKIKEEIDKIAEKMKSDCHYEVLKLFVDYLASFEKIIVDFSGDREKIEEEYIKIEIESLSSQAKLDPGVFSVIYTQFVQEMDLKNIEMIREKILEKCPNDIDDYENFVDHLVGVFKKIYLILEEEKNSDIESLKKRLIDEKMNELLTDGEPTRDEFEKIIIDFETELTKRKII